jgi:hypothetical protein
MGTGNVERHMSKSAKNGKTMLAAAIALYLLAADGESGAEIYSCEADRQQASLIYRKGLLWRKTAPHYRDVGQT